MDIKKDILHINNVDDLANIVFSNDEYTDTVYKILDKLGYILSDNDDTVIEIVKDILDTNYIEGALSILLSYKDKYEYVLVDNNTNKYTNTLNYDDSNFKNMLENIKKNL